MKSTPVLGLKSVIQLPCRTSHCLTIALPISVYNEISLSFLPTVSNPSCFMQGLFNALKKKILNPKVILNLKICPFINRSYTYRLRIHFFESEKIKYLFVSKMSLN